MTQKLNSLLEVAEAYDAIVLDQWGVLHDGSAPYPDGVDCLTEMANAGHLLAVLSNSGKRSDVNLSRITSIGYPSGLFREVMTSGDALWRHIDSGHISQRRLYPVERSKGDAEVWAEGLDVQLCNDVAQAEAILLMGLPDGSQLSDWQGLLTQALGMSLPLYCSNPDRKSPRADGSVISPGALAFAYRDMGGDVTFYGKPHRPIFDALKTALNANRILMIGDSLEHDIAGASSAGWDSILIQGGLYKSDF